MDFNKKVERQYNKYVQLLDNAKDEHDQQKADRALNKLAKLFTNEQELNKYLQSKIDTTIKVNPIH